MNIQPILDLANAMQEMRNQINNISTNGARPSVLLHKDAFFSYFQTFDKKRLSDGSGYLLVAVFCNVEFTAVVYDSELKEAEE